MGSDLGLNPASGSTWHLGNFYNLSESTFITCKHSMHATGRLVNNVKPFFKKIVIYLFIYLCLCWVFVSV